MYHKEKVKLFIECRYRGSIKVKANKLPPRIGLLTTVQYLDFLDDIRKQLEEQGKIVTTLKGNNHPGQVLGCDVHFNKEEIDCILFVGDGRFHPLKIAYENDLPVFILDTSGRIKKIDKSTIEKYNKRKRGAMIKFLSSNFIGVLYSTKPGQSGDFTITKKLRKKFPKKEFYPLLSNEINTSSLEDFPYIQAWVNTACPRIHDDFVCVNVDELIKS